MDSLTRLSEDRRLMKKQTSVRLKVTVNRRLEELLDRFPNATKSDAINDVLEIGLQQAEKVLEELDDYLS